MGKLRDASGQRTFVLEAECTVGRRAASSLRLSEPHVSSQHAVIRWRGGAWELKDQSHNGTFVNGVRLPRDQGHLLREGDQIGFGHPDAPWQVVDVTPPELMVVAVSSGQVVFAEDGMIGLPVGDEPTASICRHPDGHWKLDSGEGNLLVLENGTTFEVAGETWRFSCPESVAATVTSELKGEAGAPLLHFFVSADEEHVELQVEY